MQLRQIIFSLHLSAALQFSRHTISSLLYYDNGFHSDAKLFYIKVYFTQQIFLRSQKASHFRGAGLRNTNAFWAGRQKKSVIFKAPPSIQNFRTILFRVSSIRRHSTDSIIKLFFIPFSLLTTELAFLSAQRSRKNLKNSQTHTLLTKSTTHRCDTHGITANLNYCMNGEW